MVEEKYLKEIVREGENTGKGKEIKEEKEGIKRREEDRQEKRTRWE